MASPGRYILVNAASGTVVDLSRADGRTVAGFPRAEDDNDNQKWELVQGPNMSYHIISVEAGSTLKPDGAPEPGAKIVVGGPHPFGLRRDLDNENNFNIWVPSDEGELFVTIQGGNPSPGAPVTIERPTGDPTQAWRLMRV